MAEHAADEAADRHQPQTMNRIEAFIRPSIGRGHSRCRKLTWVTL